MISSISPLHRGFYLKTFKWFYWIIDAENTFIWYFHLGQCWYRVFIALLYNIVWSSLSSLDNFVIYCDEISYEKTESRVNFGSCFEGVAHLDGDGMMTAGMWGSWSHHLNSENRARWILVLHLIYPWSLHGTPSTECCRFHVTISKSAKPLWKYTFRDPQKFVLRSNQGAKPDLSL